MHDSVSAVHPRICQCVSNTTELCPCDTEPLYSVVEGRDPSILRQQWIILVLAVPEVLKKAAV